MPRITSRPRFSHQAKLQSASRRSSCGLSRTTLARTRRLPSALRSSRRVSGVPPSCALTPECRLENRVVKFEIWWVVEGIISDNRDTAGQERFHSLAPMYYRNAAAAVVVYDITKSQSLDKAKAWVKELQRQANPNIVIALVGNKLDLVGDATESEAPAETTDDAASDADADAAADAPSGPRQVPTAEAEAYAKECNLLFFEASAKTGQNVQDVFTEIGEKIAFPADISQDYSPRHYCPQARCPRWAQERSQRCRREQRQLGRRPRSQEGRVLLVADGLWPCTLFVDETTCAIDGYDSSHSSAPISLSSSP